MVAPVVSLPEKFSVECIDDPVDLGFMQCFVKMIVAGLEIIALLKMPECWCPIAALLLKAGQAECQRDQLIIVFIRVYPAGT